MALDYCVHSSRAHFLPIFPLQRMQGYIHTGPIDCNKPVETENLRGKTAIVTGGITSSHLLRNKIFTDSGKGANGLGEAFVRALVAAGYGTEYKQKVPNS